jgi:hypothetical protein
METQEEQWGSLVRQAEQMERKARQRAVAFTLIPVILAGLLLWFTGYQIQQANQQLASIQATKQAVQAQKDHLQTQLDQTQMDLTITQQTLISARQALSDTQVQLKQTEKDNEDLQKQLQDLNNRLDEVSKQLKLATDFSKYEYPGDWQEAIKLIASFNPRQGEILLDISGLQTATTWKSRGFSPAEGFDSPSFAAYVLGVRGLIKDPASDRYRLQDVLPRRSKPEVGDVVFYQAGYTMFYFDDGSGNPFVIGMTPLGVLALKPDFAEVIGYGAVDYQSMQ